MSKLNSIFGATVRPFNGSTDNPAEPDKNGKMPVILNVFAGKAPNARVLSGTVAERAGFNVGKSYIINCTEGEADPEYGRRFTFDAMSELSAMETLQAVNELGNTILVDVTESVKEEEDINA